MLSKLKKEVVKINKDIRKYHLANFTWGTASAIDKRRKLIVIKASGVPYDKLTIKDMVIVDLKGKVVEGSLRPSVDTNIHIEIYKAFKKVFAIVHTHSTFASSFAQSMRPIPALGTTAADYFLEDIPVTREITPREVKNDYEVNTGKVIVKTFKTRDYLQCPAVLIPHHGPFAWGRNPEEAIYNAVVLEEIAKMAYFSLSLNPKAAIPDYLMREHFNRKHGPKARYGQNK